MMFLNYSNMDEDEIAEPCKYKILPLHNCIDDAEISAKIWISNSLLRESELNSFFEEIDITEKMVLNSTEFDHKIEVSESNSKCLINPHEHMLFKNLSFYNQVENQEGTVVFSYFIQILIYLIH